MTLHHISSYTQICWSEENVFKIMEMGVHVTPRTPLLAWINFNPYMDK